MNVKMPVWKCCWGGLLAGWLVTACSSGVRLSEPERAGIEQQTVNIVHYHSALPRIEPRTKLAITTPLAIRQHAAADPAAIVAQSFSRLLGKKEKIKNLRVEAHGLALPVPNSATGYREKFRHGLVLEVWTAGWSFAALPADPKTYAMTLGIRTRLTRLADGQVLWSTGQCRTDGLNNRALRLPAKELTSGIMLRKLLAAARDECARQLVRDFGVRA